MKLFTIIRLTLSQLVRAKAQLLAIFGSPFLLAGLAMALWPKAPSSGIVGTVISVPGYMIFAAATGWASVNFHRHVLLGERFGIAPRLHAKATLLYMLGSLLLSLIVIGASLQLVPQVVEASVALGSEPLVGLGTSAVATVLIAFYLRWAAALPEVAIGGRAARAQRGLRGNAGTFLILGLLAVGATAALNFLIMALAWGLPLASARAVTIAFGVISLLGAVVACMVYASLLTAIYRTLVPPSES